MRKGINRKWVLVFLLVSISCNKPLDGPAYIKYVSDPAHGLIRAIAVGDMQFEIKYRPHELIMLQECKGAFQGYPYEQRKADLKGTAWFSISIKCATQRLSPLRYGLSSQEEYNQRLNYYLNEAVKDIWLSYGDAVIAPSSYLFENSYNLTPVETLIVGFILPDDSKNSGTDLTLSFNERIFESGILKTGFTHQVLSHIPQLIYKG